LDAILFTAVMTAAFLFLRLGGIAHVSILEFIPVVLSLIGMSMLKRENPWGQIVFFVSQVVFVVLFFRINLWGQLWYCAIWAVLNLVGFYFWIRPGRKTHRPITPSFLHPALWIPIMAGLAAMAWANRGGGMVAMLDWATLYLGIAGQVVLTKKKIDGWIMWQAVNFLSVVLFWTTGAYLLFLRSILYSFIHVAAFVAWKREIKDNKGA